MDRLKNKVIILTGAAHGIGLGTAEVLANEGATVVATDINAELLEENIGKLELSAGKIVTKKIDTSSEENWKTVVEETISEFGKIDVLINNAGICDRLSLEKSSIETWNRTLEINLTGYYLGIKAVLPYMKENGQGSIINTGSVAGILGGTMSNGGSIAYAASKGGVKMLTKQCAFEFGPSNIRVNSICPGPICNEPSHSDMMAKMYESALAIPPYHGVPKDIAYGMVYLASDESKFVTGIELEIDGGFCAGKKPPMTFNL
ncbi:MAG: SDR family oxidoreductase [Oscillospiraceae bacterium]|nr:SDR family oxidoreductase [Oscillospiraceae bacterium]